MTLQLHHGMQSSSKKPPIKIQQWPRLGHQVEKYPQEVRALFIRPYRFVYRLLNSETIEIVRILHSKRLLPEDLEED